MEYNDKQNQSTRIELLIAIAYLLDECYDEKHTSKTIRLTEYAKEKYGVFLDRRRANPILSQLYEISNNDKNVKTKKFPFAINKIGCRYDIEKRLMKDKDLVSVITSIRKDETISDKDTNRIINKLLDVCCTKTQKENILTQSQHIKTPPKNLSEKLIGIYSQLENCVADKMILHFRFADPRSINCSYSIRLREITRYIREAEVLLARVYSIVHRPNKKTDKVILHMEYKSYKFAVVTDVENIEIVEEPTENWSKKDNLDIDGFESIDAWFDQYYQGKSGHIQAIKFKFWNDYYEKVKQAYCEFFKTEDLPYTTQERKAKLYNGEEVTVLDYVCSVDCNYRAFKKWYFDYHLYEFLVVLDPPVLNDDLIGEFVERFAKRLTKYGAMYNYEVNKTLKPEEAQRREELEKRLAAIRARREERNKRQEEPISIVNSKKN